MAHSDTSSSGKRSLAQRVLLGINIFLVIACLGAAAGFAKVRTTLQSVPVVDIGSTLTPDAPSTEPRNFLIIGTDSASRLDESDPITQGRSGLGRLADVIMILRVDPADGTAKLLSVPRDTRLAIAPDGRMDRVNTGITGSNGPRNLIRTIKRNFGVSIDNYVQVDFLAFKQLVEVLGGVPVYFATPVRDANTGLKVEEPGCILLDRDQALAYARSRHFQFYFDGSWKNDGTGDLGRITRQQDFIKRALRRASDKGIRNPGTAVGLVNAGTKAVTLDSTLDVGTILDLVRQFRNFNPDSLQTDQVPTIGAPRGGIAYQEVEWDPTLPLLLPFQGVAPGAEPTVSNVLVDVRGPSEDAARVSSELDTAGFDAEALDSGRSGSSTTVTYGPQGRTAALLLAAQLEDLPTLKFDESIVGYRVILNLGSGFGGVRSTPLPLDQLPPDLAPTPPTTTTLPPPTTVATSVDGSTTSVPTENSNRPAPPGVVPTDPVKAAACH